MSDDANEYTFKITDYTPQTMPFGRLVEYYAELKKMIGEPDSFHLLEIVEGSHGSNFAVDRNFQSNVETRLMQLRDGIAPKMAKRAQDTINAMLKEDKTSGTFEDMRGNNIIEFPGGKTSEQPIFRIRDTATFTGELYHIAGTTTDAKVRISTDAYGVIFCTTTKEIAKSLRDFLFENVRVSGRGTWVRQEDGPWRIDDFAITDYAPVISGGLRDAVDRLRAIGIDWPEDPIGKIRQLDEEGGQIH